MDWVGKPEGTGATATPALRRTEEEPLGFLRRAIAQYLVAHRRLLKNPRCCIGIWRATDEDEINRIYLDISVLVYNEGMAQDFGRAGNQIAIFSLYDKREIEVGGTGESVDVRLRRLAQQDRPPQVEGE